MTHVGILGGFVDIHNQNPLQNYVEDAVGQNDYIQDFPFDTLPDMINFD